MTSWAHYYNNIINGIQNVVYVDVKIVVSRKDLPLSSLDSVNLSIEQEIS